MQLRLGSAGSSHGLALAPLYQECMLRSNERRETYDVIAGELCDYGLQWHGGPVDARAFRCRTEQLALYSMHYGDEVTITPDVYRDFFLVHLCLKNGIEVESDGVTTHVPEGAAFVNAPQKSIRLRWQEECEQLILRVPHAAAGVAGQTPMRSGALLPKGLLPVLVSQLNMLMALSRQVSSMPGLQDWVAHAETGLARFAALHLFPIVSDQSGLPQESLPDADRRDRLVSFIESHLSRPIQLQDLARATGLGRTQLNALTQEAFGCAPITLVRRLRLEAARRSLEADPSQRLTELSLRYGFEHQGRFSQYYREAFGESPRDMRERQRNRGGPAGRNG